jgi:hypothetical protein
MRGKMMKPQYPTLGDIAKALFEHTGILPQKNDRSSFVSDETMKKSIQTKLRRLAKEDGELTSNFIELLEIIAISIQEITGSFKVMYAFTNTIDDALVQYRDFLRGDSTFLSKSCSIKWLIKNRLVDRIILSYQKNMLKNNVKTEISISPSDKYWWLPDITETSITWPISKVFNWMYEITKTNQTRFHFPDYGFTDNYRLSQNLENVSRWSAAKNLPSWASLLQNLSDSLSALEQTKFACHKRSIDTQTRDSFKIILFLARLSTSVFIEIERQYGARFALEITTKLKKQDHRLSKIHSNFKNIVTEELSSHNISDPILIDRWWFDETQAFWELKAIEVERNASYISSILVEKSADNISLNDIKYSLKYLDAFTLSPLLTQTKCNVVSLAPQLYFELLFKGLALRKNAELSEKLISTFIDEVRSSGLEGSFFWLTNWLWGTYHYRRAEDNLAFPFYLKAFENGKYSAGHNQYLLVNQFVECCAKNNKWRDFQKGIAWANYLGIKVRWYRGFEQSENPVKSAFEMLKIGRYAVL